MSRGTHTKAAAWVRRLDETRGSGIDAGCKGVLQCLWDHVDFDVERPATPRECWPSAETIAEQIGSTVAAVRDRLGKLTRAGWIRFEGRGWALAWAAPFAVDVTPVVGDATPVSPGCDSSSSDSRRRRVRLQSNRDATPVESGCDSGRTNQLMNNSVPTPGPGEGDARQNETRDPPAQHRAEPAASDQTQGQATRPPPGPSPEAKARHAEISRLAESRAADRRPAPPTNGIPEPVWAVVANHAATFQLAMNPSQFWSQALGEVVAEFQLDADTMRALLDRWLDAREKLGKSGYTAAVRDGTFPSIEKLWYSRGRANAATREWLCEQIEIVQLPPGVKPIARVSLAGLSDQARLGSNAKWDQRAREIEAEQAANGTWADIPEESDPSFGPHVTDRGWVQQ